MIGRTLDSSNHRGKLGPYNTGRKSYLMHPREEGKTIHGGRIGKPGIGYDILLTRRIKLMRVRNGNDSGTEHPGRENPIQRILSRPTLNKNGGGRHTTTSRDERVDVAILGNDNISQTNHKIEAAVSGRDANDIERLLSSNNTTG